MPYLTSQKIVALATVSNATIIANVEIKVKRKPGNIYENLADIVRTRNNIDFVIVPDATQRYGGSMKSKNDVTIGSFD